jgi:hypothetical protein
METKARLLYDECVRLLSDRKPHDPKLVESATGGKVSADASPVNGENGDSLEHCKVIVSVLDHILISNKPVAAPAKRRGRPKGSKNKPRVKVAGPKKSVAEAQTRSGRDVTGDEKKPPAKKRGRPKGSKNKPKEEAPAE